MWNNFEILLVKFFNTNLYFFKYINSEGTVSIEELWRNGWPQERINVIFTCLEYEISQKFSHFTLIYSHIFLSKSQSDTLKDESWFKIYSAILQFLWDFYGIV